MKKISRKFLAIFVSALMICFSSMPVFAAESNAKAVNNEVIQAMDSANVLRATSIYVSSSGTFAYSTGINSCSKKMGWGTYTISYNVSKDCTLTFWQDSYTQYEVAKLGAGSGTIKVKVPIFRTYQAWQLWNADITDGSDVHYSITVTK